MFYFAYDGTIHGDWVSHYALRLAAQHPDRELRLLYVDEGRVEPRQLDEKLALINAACRQRGVSFQATKLAASATVFETLNRHITPDGPATYVVCGTRRWRSKFGILSGTVSEQLLRSNRFQVLAVRVNQPGLLGLPKDLLVPVSGHPRGFRSGMPFLDLFRADVFRMHILYVQRVGRWRFRTLSHESVERLRQPGEAYCDRVEREINDQLRLGPAVVDANVVISDDVPKEIIIAANKTKSRLIYLGASERNLTERLFYGNPIEQVLRDATCDVAIYRGIE
jgi:nucleotide-binding universal stress UspA family protein